MNPGIETAPEFVRLAAEQLIAARPTYRELISFYARIFEAQEEARPRLRLTGILLDDEQLRIKLREHLPLVTPAEMVFDPLASGELLGVLCRIAQDCSANLAEAARRLETRLAAAAALFDPFLKGEESTVADFALQLGVTRESLAFFLYHSLRPSLCGCAERLAVQLETASPAEQGYCPICGSPPVIAWLEGEGQRFLYCSFCWHKWPVYRMRCVFCGRQDPQQLSYFYSEEEKEYRVGTCEACRRYIKTVDSRRLTRVAYPALEQIASLHLDLKASEAGYTSAAGLLSPASR